MHQGPEQPQFPPTIEPVPEQARLAETFAFTPGALSIGAILGLAGFGIGLASHGGPRSLEDLYLPGGCIAAAVLFGLWEIVRRSRRTTLVFLGGRMGIYRGGRL